MPPESIASNSNAKSVIKLWGSELWLVNTELYCAKILTVEPNCACSLHRHLVKDETFYVTHGTIWLEYGADSVILKPGGAQRISPQTWHRFINYGHEAARILEVSTHHDDADVERREPSRNLSGPSSSEPIPQPS